MKLRRKLRLALVAGALLGAVAVHAVPALAQQGQILNLRDADIRAFIADVATLTGRIFVVDPRVQGKVTVISPVALNSDDLFELFLSTLRANGFTALPSGSGVYRIVPEDGAAQDAAVAESPGSGDTLVTEVFRLRHIDVNTALQMVQPLVHRQGRAISSRGSDAVIVVDYASNIDRIRDVLRSIDRDTSVIRPVPLFSTSAAAMARAIGDIAKAQGDPSNALADFAAVPLDGSNVLVLRGSADLVDRLEPLVRQLDVQGGQQADTKVVYLKHAAASELLPVLERISALTRKPAGQEGGAADGPAQASIGIHPATNSLVISAAPDIQQKLGEVIRQLDIPRHQVMVEAIIVEVSDVAARQLGVQYVLAGGEGTAVPFISSNYPGSGAPSLLAATGAVILDRKTDGEDTDTIKALQALAVNSLLTSSGLSAGFARQANDGTIFGLLVNALKRDTQSNVLSTPSIVTLNNQPASILVGQEIPITTGESLGTDNRNPFRTIERKDVGVKLEVKPQINEGNSITLFIRQEVSSILGPVSDASSELITNKRQLETTVMVDDGQIVVLGGLIENDEQLTKEKIPFLGDIPLLGAAFRNEGKSRRRTNLMIFLRPTIVTDVKDMRQATSRKYRYMQLEQERRGTSPDSTLDRLLGDIVGGVPTSPTAAPRPPVEGPAAPDPR